MSILLNVHIISVKTGPTGWAGPLFGVRMVSAILLPIPFRCSLLAEVLLDERPRQVPRIDLLRRIIAQQGLAVGATIERVSHAHGPGVGFVYTFVSASFG